MSDTARSLRFLFAILLSIASSLAASAQTPIVADDFDRPDGTVIGSGWTEFMFVNNLSGFNQYDIVSIVDAQMRVTKDRSFTNEDGGITRPFARTCGIAISGAVTWPTSVTAGLGLFVNDHPKGLTSPIYGGLSASIGPSLSIDNESNHLAPLASLAIATGVRYKFEWAIAADCATELRVWQASSPRPNAASLASPAVALSLRADRVLTVVGAGGAGCCTYPGYDIRIDDLQVSGYDPCAYNFAATGLNWCLSATGNLERFQSPSGAEHLAVGRALEGHVLCVAGAPTYFDMGGGSAGESGWGPPIVTAGPTATGMTIVRTSTDGKFKLEQKWTRDTIERDLQVQMSVQNVSGAPINAVTLLRYVDVDADGTPAGDHFDRSSVGTWSRDVTGISVSSLTLTKGPSAAVISAASADAAPSCNPVSVVTPGGPADVVAVVRHNIGNLGNNAKGIVKVAYRSQ